ncbi:2397_t:CDS:2 [Funneliformis mosseae]|uniref:2397_t:CDS:1 n=1 Tax=Funneliformis mosseae TaxID=27381 RepID=A0A9N8WFJ3_FUNMO|nr:2397_t:CDS:2 [Funneliformis mosseae]
MDYAATLKHLAKEAGIPIPPNSFSKPSVGRSPSLNKSKGLSKCSKCGETRTGIGWCRPCNTAKLIAQFKNWTSGNEELDQFIRDTQINANTPYDYIRWINFDSFSDLKFIAKGGLGSVFSAKSEAWGKVALKFLDEAENLARDFLEEVRAYHRCSLGSGIVDCYGVSKDPETNRYVMVMRYADHGSLRKYLTKFFTELSWDEKIILFDRIAKGLKGIHDVGMISYKWRFLSDGKAPFQGPKTKKVRTGTVKSVITNSGAVHPQAFYTSRLLHYPNLPEPQNSDTFTLFDSTTGELHVMVRKQNTKKDPSRSSTLPPSDTGNIDKGKERAREGLSRRESVKISHHRWSSIINEIPKQVELYKVDDKEKQS